MATLVLCSAGGAPGTTVTALGLTLTWPRDVMLVDADRTPTQPVLAGYLRGASAPGRGMSGLLQAHRERTPLADALAGQTITLPAPEERATRRGVVAGTVSRRFLPGFANLATVDVFGGVWRELGLTLHTAPHDVIVDAGRIGVHGLPNDLVETATRVLVVTRTSLVSLAALRLYLPVLTEDAPAGKVALLLIGPGRPYASKEIAEQFGVEVAAGIVWDPAGAADLHEGNALSPKWRRQALARAYAQAAGQLVSGFDADQAVLGVPA